MTASDTPAPELADSRRAEVRWPLRVGVAPAPASEFSPRPETAPNIAAALVPGATVALVPDRTEGPANPGWEAVAGQDSARGGRGRDAVALPPGRAADVGHRDQPGVGPDRLRRGRRGHHRHDAVGYRGAGG